MFGHLHTHTEYSLLDGACRMEELISTVKSLNQEFIAITDHGSTSGLYEAQKFGEKHNIKVLLGTEFYYQRENDNENGHLIVIAKNNEGLANIFRLQEFAYVDNFYRKPRINWEVLKTHAEGLIVTSACMASTFSQHILNNEIQKAVEWAKMFKEIFQDDFYIEIQANSIPEQLAINQASIRIAKQLGIKFIGANDVHYILKEDSFAHEILLAMQTNKKISDQKRFKFDTQDFWLKSKEEMKKSFTGLDKDIIDECLLNTLEVAKKANAVIQRGRYLPSYYNVIQGHTERSMLVEKTIEGIKYYGLTKDKEFIKEVQHEIDVIDRNGYSGYFLIVQDYVNTARKNGIIVGDGRGSGAGSKVAYLTGITKIEPHKHNLLFERFMADGRSPDFDVDFSDQEAIFKDLQSKYGVDSVAKIVAFGTLTPKNAVRKVLNTFEHPTKELNYISRLIGEAKTLDEALQNSTELQHIRKKYKLEFDVIERLEGIVSHESQHAGGIIIFPRLSSILPIKTRVDDRTKRIVGWDKRMLEDIGHYKFDVLGLETLPIIKRTLDSIRADTGIEVDLYKINYNDAKVYDMLCQGDVSGIFQINNQKAKVIEQQPRNFNDLIAINALIRPGVGDWNEYIARRKGKEWSVYPPRMPYLKETMGLLTYQEQFLLDAKTLAGWDIAFADKHIRKNKNITNDIELREKFIQDAVQNNTEKHIAEAVWDEIVEIVSGGYNFNKSHATSYAVISFQTAHLKCYYPKHFYASLMSSERTDSDGQSNIAQYIQECRERDIKILPPNINNSGDDFNINNSGINYRITAISHVGESAIKAIERLRPIKSFDDFIQRREKRHIKKNVLLNLIKAGCFDEFNPNRAELIWQVDMDNRTKTQIKEGFEIPSYEWNDKIKAEWEKEALGMYLTVHPMEKYGFRSFESFSDGEECLQGGEIYDIKTFLDKNKNEMAFVFINTLYGNVRVVVFASAWKNANIKESIKLNNIILVKGKKSSDAIILNEIEVLKCLKEN